MNNFRGDIQSILISNRVLRFCDASYWRPLWIIQEILSAWDIIVHRGPVPSVWKEIERSLTSAASYK